MPACLQHRSFNFNKLYDTYDVALNQPNADAIKTPET